MAVLTVMRRTHPSKLLNSVNLAKFLNTFTQLSCAMSAAASLPSEYLNAVANTFPANFLYKRVWALRSSAMHRSSKSFSSSSIWCASVLVRQSKWDASMPNQDNTDPAKSCIRADSFSPMSSMNCPNSKSPSGKG